MSADRLDPNDALRQAARRGRVEQEERTTAPTASERASAAVRAAAARSLRRVAPPADSGAGT